MHRQGKQGQVSWEEYRDTAQFCKDEVRKAKGEAGPELGQVKNKKKSFYRYESQKRKVKEGKQGWQTGNSGQSEG